LTVSTEAFDVELDLLTIESLKLLAGLADGDTAGQVRDIGAKARGTALDNDQVLHARPHHFRPACLIMLLPFGRNVDAGFPGDGDRAGIRCVVVLRPRSLRSLEDYFAAAREPDNQAIQRYAGRPKKIEPPALARPRLYHHGLHEAFTIGCLSYVKNSTVKPGREGIREALSSGIYRIPFNRCDLTARNNSGIGRDDGGTGCG
jgi:hypothetical protein